MYKRAAQCLILGLCIVLFGKVGAVRAQEQPNVLLIMTDDQGYGDVGVHGNDVIDTPNLDELAREGTEMTRFYVNPNCSPTRASLMTGRWSVRTGVSGVHSTEHLLNAGEVTVAEMFAEAGYRTGIFGKWHLGDDYPMRPTNQGFQEALVHKGGGIGQSAGPPGNSYFDPILEHNNVSKKYEGYCDDIFARATMDFIKKESDKPFFAYYATNLPHRPLTVSDERADPYREKGLHEYNARTYGMITNVDANVGRLMDTLEEEGIADNTIVIFLSDNGPRTRRTKNDAQPGRYVAGLRGTKTSVYENGIRVPFFIRWPGKIPAGQKIDQITAHVDVLPTLLDAANLEKPEGVKLDGISLLPRISGKTKELPDREVYFQWHNGPRLYRYVHFTVVTDKYKLISPHPDPHSIIRQPTPSERRDLVSSLELYRIKDDSSELHDVAGKHPDKVKELLGKYEQWFHDVTQEWNHLDPQRIYLGTRHQPTTTLSRFDWAGPGVIAGNFGHWKVRTERGRYRITLRFGEASEAGRAVLRYGDLRRETAVEEGDSTAVFETVSLPAREGDFEAFLELGRLPKGVRYVDVERRD